MIHLTLRLSMLLLVTTALLGACRKDETSLPAGDLFATVLLSGAPVEGVRLTSAPVGIDAATDKSGSVLVKGITAGRYQLSAEDDRFGTTSVPVEVRADALAEIVIELRVDAAAYPQITDVVPSQGASFSVGEAVFFRVKVADLKDRPDQLVVTWSSDRDGLLATVRPDASGQASFATAELSPGAHAITVRTADSDRLVSTRVLTANVVAPSGEFLLAEPVQSGAGVRLNWSPVSAAEFRGYRVHRSQSPTGPFDVLATITNPSQSAFMDVSVVYGREFSYQIALMTAGAPDQFSQTRSVRVEGPSVHVGADLTAIVPDEARGRLYGLSPASGELFALDPAARRITDRITVGRRLDGIALDPDGATLYAYAAGSGEVIRVNLDGFTLGIPLALDLAGGGFRENPTRVLALANGLLAAAATGVTGRVVLYDRSTGAAVAAVAAPGLVQAEASAMGTDLYTSTYAAGANAGQLTRLRLEGRMLVLADRSESATVAPDVVPCVSRGGGFVFWGPTKYGADDLKRALGSVGETVRACSPDGSTAVGARQVWSATRFAIERFFPVEASTVTFFDGGRGVAAYDPTSGNVYFVPAR